MCVFERHNLFSSDETCNQSPLIRYLLNTLFKDQARVVQTLDSAIHRINRYPADSVIDLRNTYPLDSDLSSG